MTSGVITDRTTAYGERVRWRLTGEMTIWLTTVGRDGTGSHAVKPPPKNPTPHGPTPAPRTLTSTCPAVATGCGRRFAGHPYNADSGRLTRQDGQPQAVVLLARDSSALEGSSRLIRPSYVSSIAHLARFRRVCDADELPDRHAEPDDRDHKSS